MFVAVITTVPRGKTSLSSTMPVTSAGPSVGFAAKSTTKARQNRGDFMIKADFARRMKLQFFYFPWNATIARETPSVSSMLV
jgi:hypothetical protein